MVLTRSIYYRQYKFQQSHSESRGGPDTVCSPSSPREVCRVVCMSDLSITGSISSSSPTASPAEVLIQAAAPHRRARSAAWSYHFYPDEAWVDLTIQLPFAVLLKEVQIQPHNASLTSKTVRHSPCIYVLE